MDPLKFLVEIQDKASSQLDDLETKIDKVLKDRSFNISIEGIGEIKTVLSQISSTLQLTGNNDVIAKFEPRIKALKEQLDSSKDLTEQYAKLISTIENRQANLSNLLAGGNSKYFGGEKGGQLRKAIEEYQSLLEDIKTKRNEGLLSDSHLKEIQRNISSIATNYKNVEKEAAKFNKAQDNAESKIKKLGMAFNDMKAYMKTHGGSEEMRRLQSEIQTAIQKMRQLMNAGDNAGAIAVFERIKGAIRQASTATKEYERSIQQTAKATSQLTAEEQRLANALNQSTQAGKGHSQILGDLKSLATQYLGVWGAQNFVHNIIEIGGQLEKQRLSIAAILQDASHGADLFDKIKRLAVQSPFGVVELDQFTKQLSAYGFKYNELYDMTKRLADISAGAGTEVSRLALALGHVRAEGALSGYTLRQFAMNNIPMVSELAKKLSEVEGHLVTTAEVRKRVSNKEIGYSDVEDVIKKLTNEGGMFFKMQETISESVQAKFKNLRDSMDIMYGDIAKSSIGDLLKDIATALTNMTRNWQMFIPIIEAGGVAFLGYKASLLAVNMTMGKNTTAILHNIMAQKQKRASDLQQIATYKTLNAAQKQMIANRNILTASDLKAAMSTSALTKEQALLLVSLRKISLEEAAAAVNMGLFTEAEVMAARQSSLLMTRVKLLGVAMKTSLLNIGTMIFNRWNALFALMSLGMSLYQKQEKYNEDRKARIEELWERSREGQRNLGEMSDTYKVGLSATLDNDGLKQAISDLKDKLKDYAPDINKIFNDAFAVKTKWDEDGNHHRENVKSLAEQYEILAKALEDTKNAYARLSTIRVLLDDAIEATQVKHNILGIEFNNPFDNNVIENIKKYADAVSDVDRAILEFKRDYHDDIQRGLKNIGMNFSDTDIDGMMNAVKNLKVFSDEWWKFKRSLDSNDDALDAFGRYNESVEKLKTQWNETSNDVMTMGNRLFKNLTATWGRDIDAWTTDQKMTVYMVFDDILGKEMEAAGYSKEMVADIRKRFMEPFGINFQTETETAYKEINALKEYLESITNKAWVVKMKVETTDSADIIADQQKKLKEAEEKSKGTRKRLKDAGIIDEKGGLKKKISDLTETEKQMYNDLSEYNKAENNAKSILDAYHANYKSDKDIKKEKGGSKKDEFLDMWKDRVSILEKYRQEREALEKYLTREQAESKLRKDGNFNSLWDYFANPNDYKGSIDSVIGKIKSNGLTNDRQKFVDDLGAKEGAEDLRVFKEETDNTVSELGRMLSVMKENYDVYKKWVDLTGDESLAAKIAGVTQSTSYADVLKDKFSEIGASANMSAEKFFGLKESEVKAFGEKSGLYKLWEEWQDNLKKIKREDIDLYEEAIKGAKGYAEQVDDVNRKLKERLAAIDKMAKSPEEKSQLRANAQANAKEEIAKYTWDNFKKTEDFGRIFSDLDKVTTKTLRGMLENLRMVAPSIRDNVEAAKSLYEALDKIEKVVNERKPFKAISDSLKTMSSLRELRSKGISSIGFRNTNGTYTIGEENAKKIGLFHNGKGEYTDKELSDAYRDAGQNFMAGVSGLKASFDILASSLEPVISLFNSLGMTELGDIVGGIQGALGSAVNTGMGAAMLFGASAGPWGAAIGAGISLLGTFFEMHDNSLQEQIEAIEREVNALEANTDAIRTFRDRTLGYDTGTLRKLMAGQYNNATRQKMVTIFGNGHTVDYDSEAIKAMRDFYNMNSGGTGYAQELENLKKQREDYINMYDLEADKKKSSQDALDEYKSKIAELDNQIAYFSQDLANELFGIDLKGWADQIGDALMTAFENGEDAAKAFKNTVQDIMRQVLRKMLSIGIIEPMMERLQKKLFGENGKGGSFDANNPEGTIDAAMRDVAEFFGDNGEGQKMIAATQSFYEKWEDLMRSYGMTLADESKSSSATAGIKGITEQTADLIASYINAIRADTSVIRAMSAQYFPMYYAVLTSGNASLKNIENHTSAIMQSNDVIAQKITNLDNNINGLKNKTWKVPMA